MVSKEFFDALADLETEKGISQDIFLEALRNALISAYKKQYENGAGEYQIMVLTYGSKIYTFRKIA